MKKGITPLVMVVFSLVLVVIGLLVFFKLLGAQIPLLFGSSDECKNSENGFSLLNEFVKGFTEGTYKDEETIYIKLQEECAIVGFGKNMADVLTRPTKCIDKSCLCLCYLGEDNDLNSDDCKRYNFCETYETNLKSSTNGVEVLGSNSVTKLIITKNDNFIFVDFNLVSRIKGKEQEGEDIEAKEINAEVLARVNLYLNEIKLTSVKYGVDENLIKAMIVQESKGVYYAVSENCGAAGLIQLMPLTAEQYGLTKIFDLETYRVNNPNGGCDIDYANALIAEEDRILNNELLNEEQKKNALIDLDARFDPAKNIDAGVKYLRQMLDEFDDKELAIAAYNTGSGNVRRYCDIETGFDSCNFPESNKETENYVPSVLGYEEYLENV